MPGKSSVSGCFVENQPDQLGLLPDYGKHFHDLIREGLPTIQAESSDPMSTMTSDIPVATISGGTFSYAERCPYWGLALCLARLW